MPPPFVRLASSCKFVKCCWNLRWKSVRSLAYATCSDVSDSSSDTSHPLEKPGKFKVTETLDQLKKEGSSALLFIRQLKESGFKHDLETYMAVVRLVCHWDWGVDVRSDNLFIDVIDNTNWGGVSFGISDDLFETLMEEKLIKAVDVLVEVYASVGRFEEAIHTLSEMKSRGGLVVSTATCNFLLGKLIEWGKVDMVESVYRQLKTNGLIPNVHTYGILMTGHCRNGCLKEAWDVFAQMEEAGVKPNAFIHGMYIHGLSFYGKTDLAYQELKNLRESNKPIDNFAYACVIKGFVKELKLQDAEDVFLDMKLRKVVPNVHCYRGLIRGYCQKGDIDKALDLCKELESRGIQTDHLYAEALCVFKHFMQQSRVFLDGASFNIAIDTACKLGKVDDAMGLVEEMKGRKIKPLALHTLGVEPTGTGVQGQGVQPNVGQHEGVQNDGIHDGVVQDAREQAALDFVAKLHTTEQTRAPHQLTSFNAHHAFILKKLRKYERHVKMASRK